MEPLSAPPPFDELEDRILPWLQVKIICGLSRTTVWRMQKSGDFPAAVQVSHNRVGWWQSELLAWKRSRTPRRLPEPRRIPITPAITDVTEISARTPRPAHKGDEADPAVREDPVGPAPRRKRRSKVAENQTAFDFGR